jgi:hypothetical protein
LNSTSPPPFTCKSMNPGASHAPCASARVEMVRGRSVVATTSAITSAIDDHGGTLAHGRAVENVVRRDGVQPRLFIWCV